MVRSSSIALAGVAAAVLLVPGTGHAQAPPDLSGRQVIMVIGFGTGSGYDTWGRIVARHIGKYLPGKPGVIAQNMPGAGSFVAINHLYSVAAKDGTVLGIVARDAALGPLSGAPGARFESTKLTWIGTPTTETNVCIVHQSSKAHTFDDLRKHEVILGDTGVGTGTYAYPKAINGLFGTKFRTISGFHASSDVFLAIERKEVEGICESLDSAQARRPEWLKDGRLRFLFQGGATKNMEIKHVPFILDLADTDEQRQALTFLYAGQGLGRPFIAPPGMAPERVKMLRDAFNATMQDGEFKADVEKSKLQLKPETGEALAALVEKIYATPKAVVERVSQLIK